MQYTKLGNSDLKVSRICMGCMVLEIQITASTAGLWTGNTSKRLEEDSYARLKYDATARQDAVIINRVAELAEKRGVSMTEISLAWLLTKVTAPVVGTTKLHHIEGAAKAVELALTADEINDLEEPYVPHKLVGVMAQNTQEAAKEQHVWSTGSQKIRGRQ